MSKGEMLVDAGEQKALDNIEKHGCHILHILEDNEHPGFAYSIGIEKRSRQPELMITGFKREIAQWIINEYNRRVMAGEGFKADRPYSGFLEGFDVIFKKVEKAHYQEYFGWGLWLYGGDTFRVFQVIYPTTSGIWPWDEDASESFLWHVPRLYAQ
jgi:Domain of unknown function (DUF4262)